MIIRVALHLFSSSLRGRGNNFCEYWIEITMGMCFGSPQKGQPYTMDPMKVRTRMTSCTQLRVWMITATYICILIHSLNRADSKYHRTICSLAKCSNSLLHLSLNTSNSSINNSLNISSTDILISFTKMGTRTCRTTNWCDSIIFCAHRVVFSTYLMDKNISDTWQSLLFTSSVIFCWHLNILRPPTDDWIFTLTY